MTMQVFESSKLCYIYDLGPLDMQSVSLNLTEMLGNWGLVGKRIQVNVSCSEI